MFLEDVWRKISLRRRQEQGIFRAVLSNCRDSITMCLNLGMKPAITSVDSKRPIARIEENNTIEHHGLVLHEMEEQKRLFAEFKRSGFRMKLNFPFRDYRGRCKNRDCEEYKRHAENPRKSQRFMPCFSQKQCLSGESRNIWFIFKKKDGSL